MQHAVNSGLENLVLKKASAVTVVTPAVVMKNANQPQILVIKWFHGCTVIIGQKGKLITYVVFYLLDAIPFLQVKNYQRRTHRLNEVEFIIYGTVGQDYVGIKIIRDQYCRRP